MIRIPRIRIRHTAIYSTPSTGWRILPHCRLLKRVYGPKSGHFYSGPLPHFYVKKLPPQTEREIVETAEEYVVTT